MSGFIKDKPRDCQYCYYWSKKAPHCTYGSKCYYSKPEPAPKKPEGKCLNKQNDGLRESGGHSFFKPLYAQRHCLPSKYGFSKCSFRCL